MPVVDLVRVVVWPLLVAFVLWRLERPLADLCDARVPRGCVVVLARREPARQLAGSVWAPASTSPRLLPVTSPTGHNGEKR
jgi:hypothetical protein